MICVRYGWNWPSGSKKNSKKRQCIFTMPLSFFVGKDVALHMNKPQSPSINGSVNLKDMLKMCMKSLQTYEQTMDNWSKQLLFHVNQKQVLKPIKSGNMLSLRQISETSNECGYYIWILIFHTLENLWTKSPATEYVTLRPLFGPCIGQNFSLRYFCSVFFFRPTSLAKKFSCFKFTQLK